MVPSIPTRYLLIATAAAVWATGGVSSRAAVLVNDTWRDGTDADPIAPVYSEMGVDSDADLDLESAWFQGGAGTLDPAASGAGFVERGSMPSGGSSSASWTTYFTTPSSPVTLARNETLRVTWKFIPTTVNASNTSQNFRLAVVGTPSGSRITGSSGAPASATFTGYAMFMNMGQTLGNSSPFQLRERGVATSTDLLSTSGNWTGLGNGATSGNTGYVGGTEYTYVMELTHNASDGLDIVSRMTGDNLDGDGTAEVLFTDTTPNTFTYDTFAVRPSGATTTAELFDFTQLKVEYLQVPEPASLALAGLAALPLVRRRRA